MAAATAVVIPNIVLPAKRNPSFSDLSLISSSNILSSSFSTKFIHYNRNRRRGINSVIVACLSSAPNKNEAPISTRLYVSGLSFRTTEEGLRNAFQNFGQLVEVKLVMDRVANRSRGFAFLLYSNVEESQKAIEGMHGKFLDGRVIFVEVAKARSELRQESNQYHQGGFWEHSLNEVQEAL